MKTIFEHIEYVNGKPHHIRKRVALASATAVTTLIAVVWFVGSMSAGDFAIQGSNFADSVGQNGNDARNANSASNAGSGRPASGVAGAAAAIYDTKAPAHIEIVDTSSSTVPEKKAEQTIIPF